MDRAELVALIHGARKRVVMTTPYFIPDEPLLQALQTAAERGVDMPTLALAWLLAHPLINPVVVGPRRAEHLQPALAALELKLGPEERHELSALFPPTLGAPS